MATLSKVDYIKVCIKERLKAAKQPPSLCDSVDKQVETTILRTLCDVKSPEHYFYCIDRLTKGEVTWKNRPSDRIPRTDASADALINIFKQKWKDLPAPLVDARLEHISTVTKRKDESPRERSKTHVQITDQLMCMFERGQLLPIREETLNELHAIVGLLCTVLLLQKSRAEAYKKNSKDYLHLRQYLSDLVITFLLLKSVRVTTNYDGKCDISQYKDNFDEIEKVSIHLCISPLNSAFQELILKEILCILYNDKAITNIQNWVEETHNSRIIKLAELVYKYFEQSHFVRLKSSDMICHIISDQSRYMATGSPMLKDIAEKPPKDKLMKLQKNFVAEKTAKHIYEIDNEDLNKISTVCRNISPVAKVNDTNWLPLLRCPRKLRSNLPPQLNQIHHIIMMEVAYNILGDKCPKVDKRFWFKNEQSESFIQFLQKLAREVIKTLIQTKKTKDKSELNKVHEMMSKFAISLQYIIYTRWCVCENFYDTAGIAMNRENANHQRVVVCLLAFRAVVMYLLPIKFGISYGVEKVADILPIYARSLRFTLDLYSPQLRTAE